MLEKRVAEGKARQVGVGRDDRRPTGDFRRYGSVAALPQTAQASSPKPSAAQSGE